ncbi:MAG TPA: cytidine deaminase [Candidatus Syntrophosphaera thermopropionivorans]|jgi:cytidine deaminase|uniref:Cytidine deaminase n=1 Tax=Candidatus Syntrophosphaera thermopropionivorans TaxID=2593015 RepID=A0AC61QI75_9BACT|nr:cytidine deaminase [Candidatus Syntrophosphaera thermopropionivorans]NLA45043.1 cytidine deaminase [Candidatus Cloacimonadota bacterium]HRQ99056.1 cytidine deaminase [Candidatus Syntrophosphaera sp.]TDF72670.1 cytidine deaminase [Candidatus Syntrophosphaera thermopropionivorans]HNU98128.1 cytidine deaminase [Candidatus Syntrophosphaera thermopropionivorans]HOH82927.1 cytidine deaminase [Candidatus Syntrophosphaera thermopropionivorans]
MNIDFDLLLDQAKSASEKAYAPYSGYKVGAALLCSDGTVFTGCNVENASYSLTICAERNAVFQAVAAGQRDFLALAIYVDGEVLFPPCGACRQVLAEFNPNLHILYANRLGSILSDLDTLLPQAFTLSEI